jgi:hypothetical protein
MDDEENLLEMMRERMQCPLESAYSPVDEFDTFNIKNRSTLVGWLLEESLEMNFSFDYMELTICLMDFYLSKTNVTLGRAQLVGCACLLIAGKVAPGHKEDDSLSVAEITNEAAGAFTQAELLAMEVDIWTALNYKLTYDTPILFMDCYLAQTLPTVTERDTQEKLVYVILVQLLRSLFYYNVRCTKDPDTLARIALNCSMKEVGLEVAVDNVVSVSSWGPVDVENEKYIHEYAELNVNRYIELFNENKKRKLIT